MYRFFFKRLFDILLSLLAIIILLPFLFIISMLVFIFMGWPIIYKQPRPGKGEKIFNMYKFRTMTNKKDENGKLLPNEKRTTKFGNILRKTSMDELPELFSVLVGKMSLIGPRPLLVEYLDYYTPKEHHRHDVKPGITGWAQVNGRNNLYWDKRFDYDLEYVENISFKLDMKILFMTIKKVIKREDINNPGSKVIRHNDLNFVEYRKEEIKKNG